MNTPIKFRELNDQEMGFEVRKFGGPHDGEVLRQVMVSFLDGSTRVLFASNSRPGFFKQVFVPWDYNDPKLVDFSEPVGT